MIPFIKFFGLSITVERIPILIISLLGMAALYFFTKDTFGERAALFVFSICAIMPWHIMQSRWSFDCNLYAHFFIFGLFFLNKAVKNERKKLILCISMIMFGACMYCYGVSIYTMPLFLIASCTYLLVKKYVNIKEAIMCLIVWLFVAWPFIAVMAINYFKLDTIETPLFTLQYFPDSVRSGDILFFSENIGKQLLENFKSTLSVIFLQPEDWPWNEIPMYGSIYKFSIPFVLVGMAWTIIKAKSNPGAALIVFMWLTGFWCGICTDNVNIHRINIIFYPQMFFLGVGVLFVYSKLKKPFFRATVVGMYLLAFLLFARCYFDPYNLHSQLIERHNGKDFGQALLYTKDTDADKLYITTGAHETQGTYALTLFYHDLDAMYYLGKNVPNGLLPFDERYTFTLMNDIEIDENEDAVYIVSGDELQYFRIELYDIQQFGPYYYVLDRK